MSDLNEIFGYKVYKPPNEELPIVPELNVYGEIVTMIDPNADVINDPTVQALLESMDGERTVKVEEMPPDTRYEGWSQKAVYNDEVIKIHRDGANLQAKEPVVNQKLLPANETANFKSFSLTSARPEVEELLAEQRRKQELQHQQFLVKQQQIEEQKRLEDERRERLFLQQQAQADAERTRLVKDQQLQYQQQVILYQLKQQQQQMLVREKTQQPATPEQLALIQKLLLQLAQLNPQLALQYLQVFKQQSEGGQAPPSQTAAQAQAQAHAQAQAQAQAQFQQQQQQQQQQLNAQRFHNQAAAAANADPSRVPLVHSMGSVYTSEPADFAQRSAPPTSAIKPSFVRPK